MIRRQSDARGHAAVLLLLAGCGPAADDGRAPAPPTGVVYTADEEANTATRLELATGETRQAQLEISPHNIQLSDDGSILLVVGPLAGAAPGADHEHDDGGLLVLLDPTTLEPLRPAIPAGEHPAHVVIDAANERVYITDSGLEVVLVVDLAEDSVVREIATCAYPHGLRLSPDGRELYVACVEADAVAVIDVATASQTTLIPVGRAPVQVGFTPDGSRVYVSLRDDDAVAVIAVATHEVIERIPVGRGPIQLFATPDGRFVYVANEGTRASPDSTVSVIDAATGGRAATITTGAGAHGVAASADGELVVVSNLFASTVSVIDVATQRVLATHPVGAGPAGITFRR